MNDFTFIQTQLENPSLKRRRDFMESYDFPDKYDHFYYAYIRQNLQQAHKDNRYLIALIELAEDIGFFAPDILPILWRLYDRRRAAVYLKLTILDYFLAYPVVADETHLWEKSYLTHLKKAQNPLIRCQLMVNLLKVSHEPLRYCLSLAEVIKRTDDYHVLLRVMNTLPGITVSPDCHCQLVEAIKENPLAKTRAVADRLARD